MQHKRLHVNTVKPYHQVPVLLVIIILMSMNTKPVNTRSLILRYNNRTKRLKGADGNMHNNNGPCCTHKWTNP